MRYAGHSGTSSLTRCPTPIKMLLLLSSNDLNASRRFETAHDGRSGHTNRALVLPRQQFVERENEVNGAETNPEGIEMEPETPQLGHGVLVFPRARPADAVRSNPTDVNLNR